MPYGASQLSDLFAPSGVRGGRHHHGPPLVDPVSFEAAGREAVKPHNAALVQYQTLRRRIQVRLADMLARIDDHSIHRLDQPMPWNWKTLRARRAIVSCQLAGAKLLDPLEAVRINTLDIRGW
jgi:hypothetical protein